MAGMVGVPPLCQSIEKKLVHRSISWLLLFSASFHEVDAKLGCAHAMHGVVGVSSLCQSIEKKFHQFISWLLLFSVSFNEVDTELGCAHAMRGLVGLSSLCRPICSDRGGPFLRLKHSEASLAIGPN